MTSPCGACGRPVLAGMRFCGYCGTAVAAWWTCASCSGENPPGTNFCGHCGRLAEAAAATAAASAEDVSETLRSFVAGQVAERLVQTGGVLPEERRLVTALFADVSGFTTLADKLDPEQLLEVIDPLISALSSIVGRYEGYVEKFAGDALLALFGAPVSHEDDAQRALHVALEMHREIERIRGELGPDASDLTLHVGVNSGHGIARVLGSEARMDYAVLGDSVILAQRLESAAPRGETYVSELTYRFARDDFEFEPVGELTLKGKLEPVQAWKLLGVRTAQRRRAATEGAPELVGREREVAAIEEALGSLEQDRGAVVIVAGEAGVGKSRLSAEIRHRSEEAGRRWLETRCLSYGRGLAYWPYAELLRTFARIGPDDDAKAGGALLAEAVGANGDAELPLFARLLDLPLPGDAGAALEPEAFRRALHDAFASWLGRLASEAPVVLAIEDLHWADAASLALTEELVRAASDAPVALYLIVRGEGLETARAVAASAPVEPHVLALEPLGYDALRTLLAGMLRGNPPDELPAIVLERTGGNPFFAEELVRALQDTDDLEPSDGGWRLRAGWRSDEVPPTVEGLLASRIDLLGSGAAGVLQTSSVIGRRIPVELLRSVASEPVDDAVAELVAGTFLDRFDDDGQAGLAFHHALVQEVAYSRLLRRQRRDLHARVADAAEALYGSGDDVVDLLARHRYLGEAPNAVEYLARAGARAKRLFANAEAIEHLSRAAELAPEDPAIKLELADLHELVGDYEDALRLYRDVRAATGDVRAWRGIASTLRRQGEYEAALELVDEAFHSEELQGADLAPLWLEQGWTLSVSGRFDQAIDVLEAGLAAIGERRDDIVGHLLLQLARAEAVEARSDDALQHALDAQSIFEGEGDLRGLATALRIVGNAYSRLDRNDEAATALRRGLSAAERVGSVEEIGGCLINLGMVELERGALEEAIACDQRAAAEFERVGHGSGRAVALGNLAEKLLRAERADDALAYGEQALEIAEGIRHAPTIADVTRTLAAVHLAQGRNEQAATDAERAAQLFEEMGAGAEAARSLELAAEARGS